MPVIRVSDRTWERLKQHARPLEDTVDDVVNAALDALDALKNRETSPTISASRPSAAPPPTRQAAARKLPQKEFRVPLLEMLAELGGGAEVRLVRQLIEPKVKERLGSDDYNIVSTGEPRWWNAICWERNDLVKEGLLRNDSSRGRWELSEQGWMWLTSRRGKHDDTVPR